MTDKPKPPINVQSDGQVASQSNSDGSISLTSKQPVSLHIETIKSVGIDNLVDVEAHDITWVFNSVSHYIKFHGGGEVRFSYNSEGNLLEFTTSNVDFYITNGECIYLKRQQKAASTSA